MKINETHESCFSFLLDTYNIPEASVRIFVHVTRGPTWNVTFFFLRFSCNHVLFVQWAFDLID